MPTEVTLSSEVQGEIGWIVAALKTAGWIITASRYDEKHFGNWYVDLVRNGRAIRLIKDRSQFRVDGSVEELKTAGLFKIFDGVRTFGEAVVAWAARPWT